MNDTDQKRLYDIATDQQQNDETRQAAIAALTDIDALLEIAAADEWKLCLCANQRLAALDRLPEETAEDMPLVWLRQPNGQPRLARVKANERAAHGMRVIFGHYPNPRAVIFCLKDDAELVYVIEHDQRQYVRCHAVKKCRQDDAYLLSLALSDADDSVRTAAARRLVSCEAIDSLLQNGKGGARCAAAKRTKNIALLKEAALSSRLRPVSREALKRVTDWTILEIVTVLGYVDEYSKYMARERFRALQEEWFAHGPALLAANQRIFADAAINDPMTYELTIDLFTDEACIADILCAISPHTAGATEYGPVGEAYWSGGGHGRDAQSAFNAIDKVQSEKLLRRIANQAKTRAIRAAAAIRLTAVQR